MKKIFFDHLTLVDNIVIKKTHTNKKVCIVILCRKKCDNREYSSLEMLLHILAMYA